MANNITFQLDTDAGAEVLQIMAKSLIDQSGKAIAARAQSIASAMSSDPPSFQVSTSVGRIRRGHRAISTVSVNAIDDHQNYIGRVALSKAKDAGRVN